MKHSNKRRIFALLVACLLVLCSFVFQAAAEDNDVDTTDSALDVDVVPLDVAPLDVALPDLTEMDAASEYIDNYDTHVVEDENFADNLKEAIATVRGDITLYATFWALLPAIIAIALALITKEVYFSLFLGIVSGALIYSNFHPVKTLETVFSTMTAKLSDTWNIGILVFLVILGIMVVLMNKAGGSSAYGKWAAKRIKTPRGAILSTFGLGALIFVDDYFNCLTVGSVMRPVTDRNRISRAKLAYIIDSTAAPICIIAPISSWAAAVTSVAPEGEGLMMFIRAIPYNFYALLTIVMIITLAVLKFDYGPMKLHETNAREKGDLYTTDARPYADVEKTAEEENPRGKVIDLVLPVIVLIVCCVLGMTYTGGLFSGESFISAFENCDASLGLMLGSFVALLITFFIYIPRRVLTFREFAGSFVEGFRSMVPAILILTFAWTISGITQMLGAKVFVAEFVRGSGAIEVIIPALVFVIAVGLAFATGTSWGTFSILLPIVVSVFSGAGTMMIISVSACLAGAVCGDHCSPISDTTIMASTGAQCEHINHVSTQLPYALTVAAVSLVTYIIAALVQNVFISLPAGIILMILTLVVIKKVTERKTPTKANTPVEEKKS